MSNSRYNFAISPQVSREFCHQRPTFRKKGAGNAGRSMRPQPCVQKWKARKQVTTVTPE
jgi:hypothetical protein